jgi:branched-chain amino acid transport system substrate-binding protein
MPIISTPTNPARPKRGAPSRRTLLKGMAAGAGLLSLGALRPARAAAPPLKIGMLLPVSGYLASEGQSCQQAAAIAPAVLADLGYSVELVSADWESKVDLARTQAEKMIDGGANLLVGAFDSGATMAIAQVCEQRGVPLVVNIAAAPQITEQGFKTVFRNFPSAPMLVRDGLAEIKQLFAATGQSPKKAVFIHVNDTFGQAMENGIKKLFPTLNMGFEIVADIGYDPKAQDLSVEVAKAQAAGGDFLLTVTHAGDAIKLVREMVKQRFDVMGVISPGSPGMYDREFFRALGKYADYAITNLPWVNPTSALSQHVEDAFKKKFPDVAWETASFNVGFTFEALLVAANAAKNAGSTDKAALLDALRKTSIAERMIIGGPISFDEKGQTHAIETACVQNREGKPVVVLPKADALTQPIFPVPPWKARS